MLYGAPFLIAGELKRGTRWEEKRTKEDPEKEERAGKIRREHAEDVSSFFAEPDWYAWSY